MTTPAVLYARISPRPEENESIALQCQVLRADCDRRGDTVVGEHSDSLKSGGRMDNRPGFLAAIDAACRQKAVLCVYTLSRFARNLRDAIEVYERLDAAGAELRALEGFQVDTSTPQGRLMFHFAVAMDQYFREEGAMRTSAAMLCHQANGRRMSNRVPWGTMRDPEDPARLVECPEEIEVVGHIQRLRTEGLSLRAIGRRLEAERIERRGKYTWPHQIVARILARYESCDASP